MLASLRTVLAPGAGALLADLLLALLGELLLQALRSGGHGHGLANDLQAIAVLTFKL
jgi:hypothetical protein